MVIVYIGMGLLVLYSILIVYYYIAWLQVPVFTHKTATAITRFSIIIPARNEAGNIEQLLQTIVANQYPSSLYEIIVVDDHSTDNTAAIVQHFINRHPQNITLLSLANGAGNSYKKMALEKGIALAKNEWIICTDADCVAGNDWLATYDAFIQKKQPVFIAAPVMFHQKNSFLQIFQTLDFITLQGITAASVYKKVHNMCNGANVAYTKEAFEKVNGFKGIDNIASGDDLLLMHKISSAFPNGIAYLKATESIVNTDAPGTWRSFLNQRIRWASKGKYYEDKRIFGVLLGVYLTNCIFLLLFITACFNSHYWSYTLYLLLLKTFIEWPFVYSVASFYKRTAYVWLFPLFQPVHILYTIAAGFLGSFGTYEWKGRKVK